MLEHRIRNYSIETRGTYFARESELLAPEPRHDRHDNENTDDQGGGDSRFR